MGFSFAGVTRIEDLTARLRRFVFAVDDLARLDLPGQVDEAVGIYFPVAGHHRAPAMQLRDGVWGYHDGAVDGPMPEGRNYTVRGVDVAAATMTVDVVIHSHGPGTEWAQRAQLGDVVAMAHARGWYRPPPDADWMLLVADMAGLPAAARILEGLTDGTRVILVAEVGSDEELRYLGDLSAVETVISLVGSGNGAAPSRLGHEVSRLALPAGYGYCWFAGEASESRSVRKSLRHQHHWSHEQYDILGYWRHDGERWARRFAEHGDTMFAAYQQAIADGKGEKRAAEEFDEALERAGL